MINYKKIQRDILQSKIDSFNTGLKESAEAAKVQEEQALKAIHTSQEAYAEAAMRQHNRLTEAQRFSDWSNTVRDNMVCEFVMSIYEPCIKKICNEGSNHANLMHNIVKTFVVDEGSANLLKQFKKNSYFLSEMALVIENAHKKVVSSVDPKDKEYVIDTLVKQNFFDKINMSNVDGICNSICNKVKDAIEDFVATNNDNRAKIAEVLKSAQAKIANTTDDTVKESVNVLSNNKIRAIENSPDNIFGEMVLHMCKNLYKLPLEERANITQKDGKLDMENIVESCKCMYTFLEMLNTTRMHKFTTEELKDIIEHVGC